jgi:UDP-glucose 4-epimerase
MSFTTATGNLVLITGAQGFIGKHLARYLARQGHQVVGLGHGIWPDAEAASWGVTHWFNGDIQPSNLRLLQQASGTPDVVYHLAGGSSVGVAIANPREDFFRTVATTAELLEWLRLDAPQARLVAVSSAAVYGSGHDGLIDENATLTPYSPYGHHKRIMEELCRSYAASYGLRVSIARLFSVFGVELKKQLLWDLCTRLAAGTRPLLLGGSGNELRDWTDVRDVVRAIDLLASQACAEAAIFNVGTGTGSSVREIATRIASHWPMSDASTQLQFSGQSRLGDPFSLVANPTRLNQMGFAWEMSVDDGLAAYVRWFQGQMGVPQ